MVTLGLDRALSGTVKPGELGLACALSGTVKPEEFRFPKLLLVGGCASWDPCDLSQITVDSQRCLHGIANNLCSG